MLALRYSMPVSLIALFLLASCDKESADVVTTEPVSTPTVSASSPFPSREQNLTREPNLIAAQLRKNEETPSMTTYKAAMPGASVIPYPIYPNATKYRIGGENGLKIVVFETEDDFARVDAFFKHAPVKDLARLQGMEHYVRYATEDTDDDPWGTHRPGIVIHHFASADEAVQFGAEPESRTNIIMSYR